MIAGRDTTAQTLTWATYMLAINPQKEQQVGVLFLSLTNISVVANHSFKLIAEIDATLKNEAPTYDQLKGN